jgi:hypothetical protein
MRSKSSFVAPSNKLRFVQPDCCFTATLPVMELIWRVVEPAGGSQMLRAQASCCAFMCAKRRHGACYCDLVDRNVAVLVVYIAPHQRTVVLL